MAVIVIDPGHGGAKKIGDSSPNNATSPFGLLEKDLTLTVARHAMAALTARGHAVTLTRVADVNVGLTARAAIFTDILDFCARVLAIQADKRPAVFRVSRPVEMFGTGVACQQT